MRTFMALFVCMLLLTACQTTQLTYSPKSPMVAYNLPEMGNLASAIYKLGHQKGTPIDIKKYSFFSDNSFGQHWLKQKKHKVITVGYPKRCARYNGSWVDGAVYWAIERSMTHCLNAMKIVNQNLNEKCGCRIVAINDNLFVNPEELPFRPFLPAVALVKDERGRKEILGYAKTSGRTGQKQLLEFYTQNDKKVCSGHYNLGSVDFKGDGELECFEGKIKGPTVFNIHGWREGQTYGTALIKAGDNELVLVYGLTADEFEKRKKELFGE